MKRAISTAMISGSTHPAVRQRIVQAALEVLREEGVQRLTQTAVAERAGIRQSHLTYYFRTRDDLIAAMIDQGAAALETMVRERTARKTSASLAWLEQLAHAIAAEGHMRLFIGMIIAADSDSAIRSAMVRATRQMERALTKALGGRDARGRARHVLAALWGLGLHRFLHRSDNDGMKVSAMVRWLAPICEPGALSAKCVSARREKCS